MRPDESPNTPNETPDKAPNTFNDPVTQPTRPIAVSAPDEENNTSPTEARPFSDFSDSNPPAVTVAPFSAPKKSKKKAVIIGLVAGLLAVLGGGYVTYATWWNAPDKVMDDALASMLVAERGTLNGVMDYGQEGGSNLKLTFDSKLTADKTSTKLGLTIKNDGQTYNMGGDFVTDKSTMYVKMTDLTKTLESLNGGSAMMTYFEPLLSQIDNKWVVITPDDITRLTGEENVSDKEAMCVQGVLGAIRTNKTYQSEISSSYQNNRFIVVKESKGTESIDGRTSNHYVLSVDEAKGKSFGDALKKTTFFKALDDCVEDDLSKEVEDTETDSDPITTPTVEMWVDTWTHKPTRFKVTSKNDDGGTLVIDSKMNFDGAVSVDVPKADTTVEDIEAEINKLQQDFAPTTEFDTLPASEL